LFSKIEIGCSPYEKDIDSKILDEMDEYEFYSSNNMQPVLSALNGFQNYTTNESIVLSAMYNFEQKRSAVCQQNSNSNFSEILPILENYKTDINANFIINYTISIVAFLIEAVCIIVLTYSNFKTSLKKIHIDFNFDQFVLIVDQHFLLFRGWISKQRLQDVLGNHSQISC